MSTDPIVSLAVVLAAAATIITAARLLAGTGKSPRNRQGRTAVPPWGTPDPQPTRMREQVRHTLDGAMTLSPAALLGILLTVLHHLEIW